MPEWLQVWIVIVTIGLVAIALFVLGTVKDFLGKMSTNMDQLTQSVRESASRIDRMATDAGSLLTEVRGSLAPVQRVVGRLETVAHRVADISSSLLDEVESPLQTATALVRGFSTGTGVFMKRMVSRFAHRQNGNHGGEDHER
jgi:uncharacterized protein YoxC